MQTKQSLNGRHRLKPCKQNRGAVLVGDKYISSSITVHVHIYTQLHHAPSLISLLYLSLFLLGMPVTTVSAAAYITPGERAHVHCRAGLLFWRVLKHL